MDLRQLNRSRTKPAFFSPIGEKLLSETSQYPVLNTSSCNFREEQMNAHTRQLYAERVYRTVIDPATGQPKEAYAAVLKSLMITPDQIKDKKIDDFREEGLRDKIAAIRTNFHKLKRIQKLVDIGKLINLKVESFNRVTDQWGHLNSMTAGVTSFSV